MSSVPKSNIQEIDLTAKLRPRRGNIASNRRRDAEVFQKLERLERLLGISPGEDFHSSPYIITSEEIPICESLAYRNRFSRLIRKKGPISHKEISDVTRELTFNIHCYHSGSIPAGLNPASDYSEHSWTRDTAIVALALGVSQNYLECQKVLTHLAEFYARKEQRDRFVSFHYHDNPVHKYRFGDRNRELPHIRAKIDATGRMVESDQDWSHNQLDAIGMWLLVTFRAANMGILNLSTLEKTIGQDINPDNNIDSIFSVALRFLNRIRFWGQHDHGPWEDKLEPSRSSSVGMGVAALKEAFAYFESAGWKAINIYNPQHGPSLKDEMQHALAEGQKVLNQRIPKNGSQAIETERYPADSALSFLLFPFNPGLNLRQERAILNTLYKNRMGEVGFTRRNEDEYLGMDYIYNKSSSCFCDISQPNFKAAEWTLFDPLFAGYYFQRYIESSTLDKESFHLAQRHLKRTLTSITKAKDSYIKTFEERKINIPRGRLPEAYWYDSHEAKWRPNENTPLLMAESAFTLMLERAIQATKLWETAKEIH